MEIVRQFHAYHAPLESIFLNLSKLKSLKRRAYPKFFVPDNISHETKEYHERDSPYKGFDSIPLIPFLGNRHFSITRISLTS